MIETIVLFSIALAALILGTYTDFKTREVPDWVSYGMIFAGLGIRGIFSFIQWDPWIFLYGLVGFGVFFTLAVLLFYAGQWGGGDAKVLMGLGALIGIQLSPDTFLIGFLVNTVLFGSLFGLLFSIVLALKHKQKLAKKAQEIHKKQQKNIFIFGGVAFGAFVFGIVFPIVRVPLFIMAGMSIFTFYLLVFIKSVEEVCMIKQVKPEQLTEGDWIVNDIVIGGKRICGPKDLGIEKKQIDELIHLKKKGKIKLVTIKEGIPFVPSFLASFVSTMLWGNFMFTILFSL